MKDWLRISDQILATLGAHWRESARTLAQQIGVSSDQIRLFLRGESGSRMDSVDGTCLFLGVSLCDADGREPPDVLQEPR